MGAKIPRLVWILWLTKTSFNEFPFNLFARNETPFTMNRFQSFLLLTCLLALGLGTLFPNPSRRCN